MRTSKVLTIAVAAALGAAACSGDPVQPGKEKVKLTIVSVSPDKIFVEGGELITVTTTNGCEQDKLTATVKDITVTVTKTGDQTYTFTAPAIATETASTEKVKFVCAEHPESAKKEYEANGGNTAEGNLTYDPSECPQPTITSYGPVGDRISVLAKMTVTFSREMNAPSITKENLSIQGIDGDVTYDAATKTATFTAKQQLEYDKLYTAIVKSGGVTSACGGKPLKTTLIPGGGTPNPSQDSWQFKTRKLGEGNPWVGDISAAAGISEGGGYKLFSVTGQPTPVGEAYAGEPGSHTYKLQSGFIYATQPPQQ